RESAEDEGGTEQNKTGQQWAATSRHVKSSSIDFRFIAPSPLRGKVGMGVGDRAKLVLDPHPSPPPSRVPSRGRELICHATPLPRLRASQSAPGNPARLARRLCDAVRPQA